MPNLLHLTDLHFGYDEDATARDLRAEALDGLIKELRKLANDWKPHILVISGDLTWRGKASGYGELAGWLTKKLFPATGLTAADCVICPGNHDLDRKAAVSLDQRADRKRADELLRPEQVSGGGGFAAPFKAFVEFADGFGIPPPSLHGEPNYLAGVRELHGLHFICANSAWFCRASATDHGHLWLCWLQLVSMKLMDRDEYDEAPVTVAVLHHPPEWLDPAECVAWGRPGSYTYLAERTHIILSGHTHGDTERTNRWNDRGRLFVGGAAYEGAEYSNNFSVLKIDAAGRWVTRRAWEMDPRGPIWEEKKKRKYWLRVDKGGTR